MWYTDIGRPSGCTFLSGGCPAANQDVLGNVLVKFHDDDDT
jgi:hypothetical protein